MIAYDIDGILTPDCITPYPADEAYTTLLYKSCHMSACFEPKGHWAALTSRPYQDKELTECWLKKFKNPPVYLFHENKDPYRPIEYKINVLKHFREISIYFESCFETATELCNKNLPCVVLHWDTFITQSINRLHEPDIYK